ncbi:MAG: sugar phosphate nucleotidyltransferase [Candidatus Shapirobacteria bacterium]|jgi:UTP--glucose-1-phosphate uridylyltransferase
MQITKAIIPVAGWSTRFLPAVKSYAKHLVPVLDKPQLQLIVEELQGAGITDFCIVHRPDETTIKSYFTPNLELDQYLKDNNKQKYLESYHQMLSKINSIEFLPQTPDFPYGNGTPLLIAEKFINNEPFLYVWGDDLTIEEIPGNFVSKMFDDFTKYSADAVIAVQEVPRTEISKYGSMIYSKNPRFPNQIDGEIEKPEADKAPSLMGQGGRFVLSPKIIELLKHQEIDRGELWLTSAIDALAKVGVVLTKNLNEYNAHWMTTGDPLSWLKVNISEALKDPRYAKEISEYISTINK